MHMWSRSAFLFLLLARLWATNTEAESCLAEEQQQVLVDIYSAWGGPDWFLKTAWLETNLECAVEGSLFPAHCCWFGVTCCLTSTCSDDLDVDRCGCEPGLVSEIILDKNNLVGNFTAFAHKPFACSLHKLVLSDNGLSGVISEDVKMHQQLSTLDLQSNKLEGSLPKGMGHIPSLRDVHLSNNLLEGTVPASICGDESRLTSISLDNNQFSGPLDMSRCKRLTYISAKGNKILVSGRPRNALAELRSVFFDDNQIRGYLPEDLFARILPSLEEWGFSKNWLSGRLPGMSMYSLKKVILDENRFFGSIPDSWSRMANPYTIVQLDANYLSCCGTEPLPMETLVESDTLRIDEVYGGVDYSAPLLPPFLELSDTLQPVNVKEGQSFKAAGMRCPTLKLAGHDDSTARSLQWSLDPSYYMFAKCECEEGLNLVNLTAPGRTFYFECKVPQSTSSSSGADESLNEWFGDHPWVVVVVVFVGCGLLVALSFFVYLSKGKALLRKIHNLKKRAHGLPKSGPFTVVVTDIQGWTALCAKHPELSVKVLNIHNSILRKASWLNFGVTHETEGDSFTIVFFDARDATAFCLQAQLILRMQQWPRSHDQPGHCVTAKTASTSADSALPGPHPAQRVTEKPASTSADSFLPVRLYDNPLRDISASADTIPPARVYNNPLSRMSNNNNPLSERSSENNNPLHKASTHGNPLSMYSFSHPRRGTSTSIEDGTQGNPLSKASNQGFSLSALFSNPLRRSSTLNENGTSGSSGRLGRLSVLLDPGNHGNALRRLSVIKDDSNQAVGHMAKLASHAGSKYLTKPPEAERGKSDNFEIRVRMGMASGVLQPGKRLHGHPTIEKAKDVSDAAAGGQILMDGSTYAEIKEFLGELGSVDAEGIHPDQVRWQRVIFWSAWFMCWFLNPPKAIDEDAVTIIDMGKYVKPGEEELDSPHFSSMGGPSLRHLKPETIHLFQITTPSDAECTKEWGGKLRMKNELVLKDSLSKGYFDAPGALAAPLGFNKNPPGGTLPMVTIVSAAVEHAQILPTNQMRQAEPCLLACTRKCLDLIEEDGYLCRMENLKLMLCFFKPEAALAWSCAMQECMLLHEWPPCVLRDPFREGRDRNGNLIFRGPRLKIGICQGRPDSIHPDRLGRAEYRGDCMRSAYNFMEGAAQGGMILCEQELAEKAAEAWAQKQPPELDLPGNVTDHVIEEAQEEHDFRTSRPWEYLKLQRHHKSFDLRHAQGPSTSPECSMMGNEDRLTNHSLPGNSLSEPLVQPPQLEPESSPPDLLRGDSTERQYLSNIHISWLGWFSFKGTQDRKMVYVLQEKLASRIYYPKSLNSFIATMVSHIQPQGPSRRTYLVPLPVLDPVMKEESLVLDEEPIRPSPSLFSDLDGVGYLEGSQHSSEDPLGRSSEDLLGASFSSWQGASLGASSSPDVLTLS